MIMPFWRCFRLKAYCNRSARTSSPRSYRREVHVHACPREDPLRDPFLRLVVVIVDVGDARGAGGSRKVPLTKNPEGCPLQICVVAAEVIEGGASIGQELGQEMPPRQFPSGALPSPHTTPFSAAPQLFEILTTIRPPPVRPHGTEPASWHRKLHFPVD